MPTPFRVLVVVSLLLFSVPLAAAPYGETAMLVVEDDVAKLDAALIGAIDSPSADVRVAAARVAAVRDRKVLVEKIEARIETESDINVARGSCARRFCSVVPTSSRPRSRPARGSRRSSQ